MSDIVPSTEEVGDDVHGLLTANSEGTVTYVDATAAALLGVDQNAVRGEGIVTIVPQIANLCNDIEPGDDPVTVQAETDSSRADESDSGQGETQVSGILATIHPVSDGVSVVIRESTGRSRAGTTQIRTETFERLHAITTDESLDIDNQIAEIIALGADRLGTDYGLLASIEDDVHEVQILVGPEGVRTQADGDEPPSIGDGVGLEPGTQTPLSDTYCRHTFQTQETIGITDAEQESSADPAYERFGLECYLGLPISLSGEPYGTVCFVDPDTRTRSFTEREELFARVLADWVHYLLEQRHSKRAIEQEQAFTNSLLDSLPDPLFAFDTDGTLLRWNDRLADLIDIETARSGPVEPADFVVKSDRERLESATRRVLDGERVSVEVTVETTTGELVPYEFTGAPLRDERDEVTGIVGVGHDISTRVEHQERLSGLLETTQSFMQAQDPEEVATIAVTAARTLLDFEMCLFRLYDGDEEVLRPVAATEAIEDTLGKRPIYDIESGYPGTVFQTGDPIVIPDTNTGEGPDLEPIRSVMYYPVGVRGTMSVCATEPDAFDETDQHLLGLLATSAAAACARAERERDVREARQHTERVLDLVNGLVSNVVETLVEAATREELESGVVTELAAADPYTSAWIARPDVAEDNLTLTAWAGDIPGDAGAWSLDLTGDGPLAETYNDGESRVFDGSRDGTSVDSRDSLTADGDSLIAIPLTIAETIYGILGVTVGADGGIDERERVVLEALGRATANAIYAVERRRLLDATNVVELEFTVDAPDLLFNRLARDGRRLESAGSEFLADGSAEVYIVASNVDPEAFIDRVRSDDGVSEVTALVTRESECLLDVVVEDSILSTLTKYGAAPTSLVAEDGTTQVTVELPYEREARELFSLIEDAYPSAELRRFTDLERPVETRQDFTADISDRLTDRQQMALETAYLGGFFEQPRDVDGNELANAMDISRPTFHQHLRAAQSKVFEELFE